MQPEQYEDLDKISTLERVLVGFGSKKRNQEFEAMMRRAGKERFKEESSFSNNRVRRGQAAIGSLWRFP